MKILLNGANGKMGNEVIEAARHQEGFEITAGVDRETRKEKDFTVYRTPEEVTEKVDVIIDFSVPAATLKILEYAKKNKIPMVIATTGLNERELEKIKEVSKKIPIFRSSNMSLDINLMAKIVQNVAKVLSETDIEIIETHHNRKIDSPSGTAILLAETINEVLEKKKNYTFDRMQRREARNKNEIGFSSVRGGNIVGEHTVQFFGENETLEITHKAYSRQVFAEGALKAAKFIVEQENGLYDMKNLVK